MTETNADNVTDPERDRDGLFAFAPNTIPKTIRGKITTRWRPTKAEHGLWWCLEIGYNDQLGSRWSLARVKWEISIGGKTMKTIACVQVVAVTLSLCCGCGLSNLILSSCTPWNGAVEGTMVENVTYAFLDRSDALYEHQFIIRNGEVFAQKMIFPGGEDRQWYFISELPEDLIEETHYWALHPGDNKPPFLPPGPWWARSTIPADTSEQKKLVFFCDKNKLLREWLMMMRNAVVISDNKVDQPPEWVTADQRILSLVSDPQ